MREQHVRPRKVVATGAIRVVPTATDRPIPRVSHTLPPSPISPSPSRLSERLPVPPEASAFPEHTSDSRSLWWGYWWGRNRPSAPAPTRQIRPTRARPERTPQEPLPGPVGEGRQGAPTTPTHDNLITTPRHCTMPILRNTRQPAPDRCNPTEPTRPSSPLSTGSPRRIPPPERDLASGASRPGPLSTATTSGRVSSR